MGLSSFNVVWRLFYCLVIGLGVCILVVVIFFVICLAWKPQRILEDWLFGSQSVEVVLLDYASKDVIGDLGGMKVSIPRECADYVEYDGDPAWGERRKGSVPERTFESKLKSFGIDVRFPEMICKESQELRRDYLAQSLKKENPWLGIGINAGENYPSLGAKATNRIARLVVDSVVKPTKFWFDNYERLSLPVYGLDAYVVTGIDPKTGKAAKDSEKTEDMFFEYDRNGLASTYISCGKTYVSNGVASCSMSFGLEPKARVNVTVRFVRGRLHQWRQIKDLTVKLLTGLEVKEAIRKVD